MIRWLLRLAMSLGLLLAVITFVPVLEPWIHALTGPWPDARGDVLIVLGNETNADHIVGQKSYWRCVYAVRAWREGGFRTILISGGEGIADSMRDFLVASGVPADAVVLERRAMSTRENALFIAPLLPAGSHRLVLLTSDYHMYRAWRAFRKAGIETTPRPFPDAGKNANSLPMRWPVFITLVGETAKVVLYRLRGWA